MFRCCDDITTIVLELVDLVDDILIERIVEVFVFDVEKEDVECFFLLLVEILLAELIVHHNHVRTEEIFLYH